MSDIFCKDCGRHHAVSMRCPTANPAPDLLPLLREARNRLVEIHNYHRTEDRTLMPSCLTCQLIARLDAALAPEAQGREVGRG